MHQHNTVYTDACSLRGNIYVWRATWGLSRYPTAINRGMSYARQRRRQIFRCESTLIHGDHRQTQFISLLHCNNHQHARLYIRGITGTAAKTTTNKICLHFKGKVKDVFIVNTNRWSFFSWLHNYLPGVLTHTLSHLTPRGELIILQLVRRAIYLAFTSRFLSLLGGQSYFGVRYFAPLFSTQMNRGGFDRATL